MSKLERSSIIVTQCGNYCNYNWRVAVSTRKIQRLNSHLRRRYNRSIRFRVSSSVSQRQSVKGDWFRKSSPVKGRVARNVWVNFTSSAYNQTCGTRSVVWKIKDVGVKKHKGKTYKCVWLTSVGLKMYWVWQYHGMDWHDMRCCTHARRRPLEGSVRCSGRLAYRRKATPLQWRDHDISADRVQWNTILYITAN